MGKRAEYRADLAQYAAAISEQVFGDGRQDETAPDAIEKPDAELPFEVADVPGEGRLTDAQVQGGP